MSIRRNLVAEAGRRAVLQLESVVRDLRSARFNAGLSQSAVASAIGVSRPLLAAWEAGRIRPTVVHLGQWSAVVGLDLTIRAYPGGPALRDAGQLRILGRLRIAIGDGWTWRTEVPISADPRDMRAFDAVLARGNRRVAVEAIGRLVDAQGQVRPIMLKQEASGIERVMLVLADSRHNRAALTGARPTVEPAFPASARHALAALRAGELPNANAVVMV